jgi:hypothetical protein
MAILALVMALARVDAMIEKHRPVSGPAKITLTYEDTRNNPGRVKPIPRRPTENYGACPCAVRIEFVPG